MPMPRIICLCGSTKFRDKYREAEKVLELRGYIVLSVGSFGELETGDKAFVDELHLRKIDLASEILVLNVDGYIGESTRREIEYAKKHNKKIRYVEGDPE